MSAMTYGMTDLKKCITQDYKVLLDERKDLEKRISDLERWRWIVLGGSITFAAFANQIIEFLMK